MHLNVIITSVVAMLVESFFCLFVLELFFIFAIYSLNWISSFFFLLSGDGFETSLEKLYNQKYVDTWPITPTYPNITFQI